MFNIKKNQDGKITSATEISKLNIWPFRDRMIRFNVHFTGQCPLETSLDNFGFISYHGLGWNGKKNLGEENKQIHTARRGCVLNTN